jgi:hypothetical protein
MVIYGLRLFLISGRSARAVIDYIKIKSARLAAESFDWVHAGLQVKVSFHEFFDMGFFFRVVF